MKMHIGHVAMGVEDLDVSARHAAESLGLRITYRDPTEVRLSANEKSYELQLLSRPQACVDHVGLEVESDADLEEVRDRVIAAGSQILSEVAEAGLASAIRFVGPAGLVHEVYTGMVREPLSVAHMVPVFARRFGHLTFNSDDPDELLSFWIETLGFRVSDRVPGGAWLRCDTDHHGLACGLSDRPGTRLQHYAFEFRGLDAIGAYADHLARRGERIVWGPGRHGPGRNIFTYTPDPSGCIIEAYADLLRIEDEASYVPIDWTAEASVMNVWGEEIPANWDTYGIPVLPPEAEGNVR